MMMMMIFSSAECDITFFIMVYLLDVYIVRNAEVRCENKYTKSIENGDVWKICS